MRILGIDPGLNITGYGMIEARRERLTLLEAGVVRSNPAASVADRLSELAAGVREVVAQFSPTVMAVEGLYSHYAHPTTAIIMGHARGVILLQAAEAGIEIAEYASTRIKKALTGNGRATKQQVQKMITSQLALKSVPGSPDAADALAAAVCHARVAMKGEPVFQ